MQTSSARRTAFLDRDGIINFNAPNSGYVLSPAQFELIPEVIPFLQALKQQGFEFVVITNQQGIGKGLMSEADLAEIHSHMEALLASSDVDIRKIYHCPHLADAGCRCRKPEPGMIFQAAREQDIDLTRAIFIGDSLTDAEAGQAAGVQTFLLAQVEPDPQSLAGATPVSDLTEILSQV